MSVVRFLTKFLTLLALVCVFFIFQSCGKSSNQNTKVTFKLPILNKTSSSKISSSKISELSTTSDVESNSKTFYPNSINDINCYAVIVSGPEANLSRSSCGLKQFVTLAGTTTTTSTTVRTQNFGILYGRIFQGNTISLDVPAGSDRVFHLIGFQSTDASTCIPITSGEDDSSVSQPYLLGSSSPVNLTAGAEVQVPISLPSSGTVLATNNLFIDTDSCVGPDVPGNNNSTSVFSALTIDKVTFPAGVVQAGNTCNTLTIKFRNQNGQIISLPSNDSLALNALVTSTANTTSVSSTFTFYDNDGCNGTAILSTSTTLPVSAGISEKKLSFFSGSTSTDLEYAFAVKSNILQTVFQSPTMINANLTSSTTQLYGPTKILADTCYKYQISEKNILGEYLTTSTSFVLLSKSNDNLNFYSDSTCSQQLSLNTYFNSLSVAPTQNIYAKFTNSLINEPIFIKTGSTNGLQVVNEQKIIIGKGDNIFDHIKINSPDFIYAHLTDLNCFGPYSISFENSYGTSVNLTSATVVISSSNSNFIVNSSCNYSTSTSSPTSVAWNSSGEVVTDAPGMQFYIYYPVSGTAISTSSTLTFTTYLPSTSSTTSSTTTTSLSKILNLQIGN